MSEKTLNVDFSEMTNDELIKFKKHIEEGYERLCEQRAKELAELSKDENFDPYSFWGSRKITKITDKYSKDDDGFEFLLEELLKEFEQRQISLLDLELRENIENQELLSDEEYIASEIAKNNKFKHLK